MQKDYSVVVARMRNFLLPIRTDQGQVSPFYGPRTGATKLWDGSLPGLSMTNDDNVNTEALLGELHELELVLRNVS